MKTVKYLMILVLLFSFIYLPSYSQVNNKGFNYQAVARDINGTPIPNKHLIVEVSIRAGGSLGTIVWQEEQNAYTNDFGLFTLGNL